METKSYTLNNTIQLIDISKDYSKFRTMYNITCDNLQDEFEYAIVSQKKLDQKQFNFKKSVGYIEDSFTQVDNSLDSDWYLILKANKDTPCSVMVDITSLDEDVLDEETPIEEKYENYENYENYPPPPSRQRTPIPKRKQTRFNSKPIIHGDSDSESEDDEPVSKKSTNKAKLYKYIFIGLLCLLLIVGGLWWSGYLYKIPFLSKFKPSNSGVPTPVVPPQYMIPQAPAQPPPQPQMQIPRPSYPQPLTAPQPISMYTEPQQYVPDPDFINEMRDLKIDI